MGASRPHHQMLPHSEPSGVIPREYLSAGGHPECYGWRKSGGVPGELLGSPLNHTAHTVLSCLCCCLCCCRCCWRPDSWGQGREGTSATSPPQSWAVGTRLLGAVTWHPGDTSNTRHQSGDSARDSAGDSTGNSTNAGHEAWDTTNPRQHPCLCCCLCRCRRGCWPSNCGRRGRKSGVWNRGEATLSLSPPHHFTSGSWDNANTRYHPANSWYATNSRQDTSSCHRGDGDRQLGVTGAQPASPPAWEGGSSCPSGEMGDGCAHGGQLTIFCCCFRCCRLCSNSWGRTWTVAEVPSSFPSQLPHPAGTLGTSPSCQYPPPSPLGSDAPLQAVSGVTLALGSPDSQAVPSTPSEDQQSDWGVLVAPPCPCQSFIQGLPGRERTCPGGVHCLSCPDASSYPAGSEACNHKQKGKDRSGTGPRKGGEPDGAAPLAQRMSPSWH